MVVTHIVRLQPLLHARRLGTHRAKSTAWILNIGYQTLEVLQASLFQFICLLPLRLHVWILFFKLCQEIFYKPCLTLLTNLIFQNPKCFLLSSLVLFVFDPFLDRLVELSTQPRHPQNGHYLLYLFLMLFKLLILILYDLIFDPYLREHRPNKLLV